MAVGIETTSTTRERGTIPLRSFSFHRENVDHDLFRVSLTDTEGSFTYTVRCWGNMVDSVSAYTKCIAHAATCLRAKRDIYMTGHALVAGVNIRVVPISHP